MKIQFYYKDFLLGLLTFENGNYVYNSNVVGEELARKKYSVMRFYGLFNCHNVVSNILFPDFEEFLEATNRADIISRANIMQTDSPFEKLYKFSLLNIQTDEFYIASVK